MTDKQRRVWQWGVAGCYPVVVVAVVLGVAPVWCLGVVFALPLASRALRQARGARDVSEVMPPTVESAAVFVSQVGLGYVIRAIVR